MNKSVVWVFVLAQFLPALALADGISGETPAGSRGRLTFSGAPLPTGAGIEGAETRTFLS
ncbi:hypothetical protein [Pseudomarimonas salicorniae]|uniref:Uncharacterized protein n=1 Tax=Pseudomarimonas salicorniae TaxID=2933270 RepID=A0ABT0GGB9_9GAMM|nr:hypothetical protein [Lysobacter sp. CAU 1642]MCK7593581.1 hypothetical protein [Lysobacter sp. CAU 1642]